MVWQLKGGWRDLKNGGPNIDSFTARVSGNIRPVVVAVASVEAFLFPKWMWVRPDYC